MNQTITFGLPPAPWTNPYGWAGLVTGLVLIYAMARLFTWLTITVTALPARGSEAMPWYERARRLAPSRGVWLLAIVIFLIPVWPFFSLPRMSPPLLRHGITVLIASSLVVTGVLQTALRYEARVSPAFPLCPRAKRNIWIAWILRLFPILLIAYVLSVRLPNQLNRVSISILVASFLAIGLYTLCGRIWLLRRLGVLHLAGDRLRAIADDVSKQLGYSPRLVSVLDMPFANALAWLVRSEMTFTAPALAILDDREVAVVCAHEITHLQESRLRRWPFALNGFLFSFLACGFAAAFKPLQGEYGLRGFYAGIFGTIAIVFAVTNLVKRLHHGMEQRADTVGKGREAAEGEYARALEKLYRVNLTPVATANKNPVYPDLYDRMIKAGVTPDYPRPQPTGKRISLLGLFLLILLTAAGASLYYWIGLTLPTLLLSHANAQAWSHGAGLVMSAG